MDPSLTAAFATIVSLLADYAGHRADTHGRSFDDFMSWLSEQRHDEIRRLLERNETKAIGIKALLADTRQDLIDRLKALDQTLATVAAGMDRYRAIAAVAHPGAELSSQAISILEQFNDLGASKIEHSHGLARAFLRVADGSSRIELDITDQRFLEDDLKTLVKLGFLDSEGKSGNKVYLFKRTAARFVEERRRP